MNKASGNEQYVEIIVLVTSFRFPVSGLEIKLVFGINWKLVPGTW